jgi:hypothetical protein
MIKWRVELSGDNYNLAELSKSFSSEKQMISKESERYFLSSSNFNEISDADIIHRKSEIIVGLINGGSKVIECLKKPITVGSIESFDDSGKKNVYIYASTALSFSAAVRPTLTINGIEQESLIYKNLPIWIMLAAHNENVAKVFKYLEIGNDDIDILYKIYEIIEDDVGGEKVITENKWASSNKIGLFRRTANSPDAIGIKARHGVQKNQPPLKPMSLNESKSFISQLLKYWLDSKQ